MDAKIYYKKCKSYFCNKCQIHHSEIFESHTIINIDNNSKDIFLFFCNEQNHNNNLIIIVNRIIHYAVLVALQN